MPNEATPDQLPENLLEWTTDQIADRHAQILEQIAPVLAKPENELSGADQAAKAAADKEIRDLRAAFVTLTTPVDVDTSPLPTAEPAAAEPAAAEPAAAEPAAAEETEPTAEETEALVGAAHQAHLGAPSKKSDAPTTGSSSRQRIRRAGLKGEPVVQDGWDGIDEDYAAAVKSGKQDVEVWRAQRFGPDTPVLTNDHTAKQMAEIMGLSGVDLNRADNCPDARFINDTPICLSLDDELQEWIPKFGMSDTCVVKVRAPLSPGTPTIFEWAYREPDPTDNDTIKTGLVNTGTGAITAYDPDDTATWKPLSPAALTCTPTEHKLRSVGYIREIDRGLDLCDRSELERQLSQDTAYLAQSKSASIITAMNAHATASSNAHTFDGVSGTDAPFANAQSALAWLFAETLPVKAKDNGVNMATATLIAPRSISGLMGVARYESLVDNNAWTLEALGEAAGVGDVLTTDGIAVTGGVGSPVPTAVLPTLGRTRTFDIYVAQRNGWRQGQGPGVRGSVTSDERNLRGNKRLAVVEDDLTNIPVGCLPVVRYTVTVCFVGGYAAPQIVECSPAA